MPSPVYDHEEGVLLRCAGVMSHFPKIGLWIQLRAGMGEGSFGSAIVFVTSEKVRITVVTEHTGLENRICDVNDETKGPRRNNYDRIRSAAPSQSPAPR
jgi:hypothetical protein